MKEDKETSRVPNVCKSRKDRGFVSLLVNLGEEQEVTTLGMSLVPDSETTGWVL